MKKTFTILFVLILLISGCSKNNNKKSPSTITDPQETLDTFEPIDAFVQNEQLGRGVNMGNTLEAYYEGEWGYVIEEEHLHTIYDGGFNTIRVPVRWAPHALEVAPFSIDLTFFARIDWVVETALKIGLNVVLNIHHFDDLYENPDATQERYIAFWEQIATRYKDYPKELVFELLNEPHGNLGVDEWNSLLLEALAAVRISNPERNIIIGPANWNGFGSLAQLQLPENDRHIIGTFHYYSPFNFTHQGAGWVGTPPPLGTTWRGTISETNAVKSDFDIVDEWIARENRPIFMGEFGAYEKAEMDYRYLWTKYIAREAENRGYSWCYWEFAAGFGIYDRNTNEWKTLLHNALVPPQ